ncbi:hypothetical protein KY290_027314 [Solanum tuberosum]|uniref:C-JID domain-containing protein n=1 Tax=Solanum tuberosum TaxID=4113 RepID=A0ABQ7UEQ7_SOLTU|nr:hypothetical protein KY290_027314 [Solanum tuberosum]
MKSVLEIKVKGIGIGQCLEDGVFFVFPQVNEGLRSLEILNLSFCNLIDGGLPEDIGCLLSLKELHLNGNIFLHLPESIAQLGDLETLYLSNCKRLPHLLEFSKKLHTISADWSNDLICNSLFQNISSASNSLSLRALMSWGINIPAHLIPLCDDGISGITQKLALSNHSECNPEISFLLIPLFGLWDTSKANGRTPNDYGFFRLCFYCEMKYYGLHLLYKVDPELDANCSSSKKYSNILRRVVSFFSCKPRNLD